MAQVAQRVQSGPVPEPRRAGTGYTLGPKRPGEQMGQSLQQLRVADVPALRDAAEDAEVVGHESVTIRLSPMSLDVGQRPQEKSRDAR
jgi:hypothetical protein